MNEALQEHIKRLDPYKPVSAITCADGFSMSVQAGEFLYCSPRDNIGPYCAVEVGFLSEIEDQLIPYIDDPEEPTNTIYGYVPIEIVERIIEKHGGWVRPPDF